jgi:hypothetical protein
MDAAPSASTRDQSTHPQLQNHPPTHLQQEPRLRPVELAGLAAQPRLRRQLPHVLHAGAAPVGAQPDGNGALVREQAQVADGLVSGRQLACESSSIAAPHAQCDPVERGVAAQQRNAGQ